MELTLNNNLGLDINNNELEQNNFLNSTLGKVINTGLNLGLRALLPDVIEDQVIDIKDAIFNNGIKAGLKQAINSAIDIGKSAIGIFTGSFDNINQAHQAIKKGGLLDSTSELIDLGVNNAVNKDLINKDIASLIKNGKGVIINTIESNINKNFMNQINSLEYLEKYKVNWKEYYDSRDFDGMEREYKKIKERLKEIMPIENTMNSIRTLENLHLLIKNNGQNFDLSSEQIELAKTL